MVQGSVQLCSVSDPFLTGISAQNLGPRNFCPTVMCCHSLNVSERDIRSGIFFCVSVRQDEDGEGLWCSSFY